MFIIDYSIPLPGESKYNATIARKDVVRTFVSCGATFMNWHPITTLSTPIIKGIINRFGDVFQAIIGLRKIKREEKVYFQYPHLGNCLRLIIMLFKAKRVNVTLLIHDLEFLRHPDVKNMAQSQIALFNSVDKLIVHTSKMKTKLIELGVKTPMDILQLFDYYSVDSFRNINEQLVDKNIIAFAGNLNKSAFLKALDKSSISQTISFRLYGFEPHIKFSNNHIYYQGKFSPEHTSSLHAGWGLVWDGDSIDTCTGSLGNYLKYIAPHKMSLYLAAGIPVIVWNKSAQADYVRNNKIGIAINSIEEAYAIINNINNEEYQEILANVREVGETLRGGGFLKRVIHYQ